MALGDDRIRVAIIGGGCAGLAAAYELTHPAQQGRYAVTVHQMGFRLGGKGASGRGPSARIEEHGLHLWMGYYENAFRLMRECYLELNRDSTACPIATFEQAFQPANTNAATDWTAEGGWSLWSVEFPALDGLPGDPQARSWSVMDYLVRATALLRTLFATLDAHHSGDRQRASRKDSRWPADLSEWVAELPNLGRMAGLGLVLEGLRFLEGALSALGERSEGRFLTFVDGVHQKARRELEGLLHRDDRLRRLWEIADITLATVRGAIKFRLALDARGFDAVDHYDARRWLLLNGASRASVNSAFIRGLYDLAFAYADGDPNRPSFSAAAALRGSLRAFFTYRGAFFWRMGSGMGDVVFAPLYELLQRRGVQFEFFHRLETVRLNEVQPPAAGEPLPPRWVRALEFSRQARTKTGLEYQPLMGVKGLPCWPAQPLFDQLIGGEQMASQHVDFESPWDAHVEDRDTLLLGRDFDLVVLAVGLGAIPQVCREICEQDERWQAMIEHLRSVPTQAFQLWLKVDRSELGRPGPPLNVSGFVEPFDTWADMTHVAPTEDHPVLPRSIAYFCNVLSPPAPPSDTSARGWCAWYQQQRELVRGNAVRFLETEIRHLWPRAVREAGFRWDLLASAPGPSEAEHAAGANTLPDAAAFDSQYWTANVKPSDAYTQALPGSAQFRISPLDNTYENLTVAGDWTQCGLNMGCVEAAVMSGRLAANAVSQYPPLEEIVGFDHP